MTVESAITVAFLAVSLTACTIQTAALRHLRASHAGPWLIRTASCRVACASLYVGVGLNALTAKWAVLQVSFGVFCVTQAMWQVNAILDARIGRREQERH